MGRFTGSFLFVLAAIIFFGLRLQLADREREVAKFVPMLEPGEHRFCMVPKLGIDDPFHCAEKNQISANSWLKKRVGDSSLLNVNKKFLFAIHVTTDSLGQTLLDKGVVTKAGLINSVAAADTYFQAIGMEFEAEDTIYIIDNYRFNRIESTAELSESASLYGKQNRINLFVVEEFGGEVEGAAGIAGSYYMHLPGSDQMSGTIAHETGHVFTLEHTFGTGDVIGSANGEEFPQTDELVNGVECDTRGDFVCDTPADPYIPNDPDGTIWFENCVFVYDEPDSLGFYYDPEPGNIMSYYTSADCPCRSFLSDGQLRRVANAYYSSTSRYSWW